MFVFVLFLENKEKIFLPPEFAVNLIQCVAGKRPWRPRKCVKHGADRRDGLPIISPWNKSSHDGLLPLIDRHL